MDNRNFNLSITKLKSSAVPIIMQNYEKDWIRTLLGVLSSERNVDGWMMDVTTLIINRTAQWEPTCDNYLCSSSTWPVSLTGPHSSEEC